MVLAPLVPCAIGNLLCDVGREKFGSGALTDTLWKVAVASVEVVRLLTASPTYTFCAMLTVWLVPNCVQFTLSAEPYMLNTFPLLASLIQDGRLPLPKDWKNLLAPGLVPSATVITQASSTSYP